MPKRSNEFQRMIYQIEAAFAPFGAKVTESKLVQDFVSGEEREIDIAIESSVGNHTTTIAIECQDRKRPANISWIEQLHGKYQHLPVDKVIAVTRNGFTQPAEAKAKIYKIVTKRINQVEQARFVPTHQKRTITLQRVNAEVVRTRVNLRERGAEKKKDPKYERLNFNIKDVLVYSPDGKNLDNFAQFGNRLLRAHDRVVTHAGIDQIRGEKYIDAKIIPPEGTYVIEPGTDREWILENFIVERRAIIDARDVELEIMEYMGIEFLYGSVAFDEGTAKALMLYDGSGVTRCVFEWTGPSDGPPIAHPIMASD